MKKLIFTIVAGVFGLNLNAGVVCETSTIVGGIKTVVVYSNNFAEGPSMTVTKGNVTKKLFNVTYDDSAREIHFGGSEGFDPTFGGKYHVVEISAFRRDGTAKGTYAVTNGLELISQKRVSCEFTFDLF